MFYYDKSKLLSYALFFNMLIGNRGGGKTYGFKGWAIDDFLKTGRQFVWVRRLGTEIEMMKKSFFKDIEENYKGHTCKVTGSKKSGQFYIDNKVCGYYFALSTASIAKSSSYPLVDKIIFDEFLIIGNTYHYLSDEVVMLLELVETIFRDRDGKPDAIQPRGVYLLGNNITVANPYFMYFKIPDFKGNFYTDKKRGLLVEKYASDEFIEMKKKSKIGRLTADTTYSEYSIENKSYLDNDKFIAKKPNTAVFNCALDYKGRTYGFWTDYKQGYMYVNEEYDPYSYFHFSLTRDDHSINTFLIKNKNSFHISNIVWLFRTGCMFFDNQQTKSAVYELLAYFVK